MQSAQRADGVHFERSRADGSTSLCRRCNLISERVAAKTALETRYQFIILKKSTSL